MLGFILGGLGSAATAAGMSTLGAGLTAAGTALGASGISGIGGAPGIGGVGPGSAPPGSMPFGFDMTKLLDPAAPNLGTSSAPSQKPIAGLMDKDNAQTQALMQQTAQAAAPQAPASRAPADISQLLAAIRGRGTLGT